MSDTSLYELSIRLNEAFSSDECRLSCIMCAADILEEALENNTIKELHGEIQSLVEMASRISRMASEFEHLTTQLENKLRCQVDKGDEGQVKASDTQ
jgi:DNA-binding ferritin-like protein